MKSVRLVAFALLCGLLGETLEIVRLEAGGISGFDGALRVSLFFAYAGAGAVAFCCSLLIARQGRAARTLAATLFGVFLFLPWLNFDYLPRFFSLTTLIGSSAATLLICLLAAVVARLPRLSGALVLLLAAGANVPWLLGIGAVSERASQADADPPPFNVFVVLIDTLRADHLGAYGYDRPTSPHFDELASSSVLFERAVSQAAWTKPATASLFTGAYVHRHGTTSGRSALATQLPTLAEALRAEGLITAGFSANPWITPEFQFDRGFDHFVSQHAMGPQLTNAYRLFVYGERFLRRRGWNVDLTDLVFWGAEENPTNSQRDESLTDDVLEWLEENADTRFFVYLHLIGPHDPYDPPAELVRRFRTEEPNGARAPTRPPGRVQSIFERAQALEPSALDGLIAQYDGSIVFADALLGRIRDGLERLGVLDDTLLIVTSDHGEEFYEHGNWRHGNQLYDEVIRIPMLMRLPARLTPARRTDPAMLLDVFPTVLGALGRAKRSDALDGRDLFAVDDDGGTSRPVFSEHWRFEGGKYFSRTVYRDGFKLTATNDRVHGQERFELYDLRADPGETVDLLSEDDHVYAPRTNELKNLLADFEAVEPRLAGEVGDVDLSTRERLHQLGY